MGPSPPPDQADTRPVEGQCRLTAPAKFSLVKAGTTRPSISIGRVKEPYAGMFS